MKPNKHLSSIGIIALFIPTSVILGSLLALLLLMAGVLYSGLFLALFIPLLIVIWLSLAKYSSELMSNVKVIDLLAIGLIFAWFAGNAFFTTRHLFIDRDPGFYANTAVRIKEHSDLNFNYINPYAELKDTTLHVPGFDKTKDGQYVQGAHTLPALVGLGGRIMPSLEMMFIIPAFIGGVALMAFYTFSKFTVGGKWALMATGLLGTVLPFFHFSRDTYTEPLTLAGVFTGAALVILAQKRNDTILWLLAGLVFGATITVRIDGLMLVTSLVLALALYPPKTKKLTNTIIFMSGLVFGVAVLFTDVMNYSPVYYRGHKSQMLALLALALVSILIAAIYRYMESKTSIIHSFTVFIKEKVGAYGLMSLFILGLIFMLSRPLWYVNKIGKSNSLVENIQRIEGLDIEGTRKYAETTLYWLIDYIGPITATLSIIGALVIIYKFYGNKWKHLTYWALLFIVPAIIYLNRPSITPDHIWASRRFLPVIIPSLVFMAAVSLKYLDDKYFLDAAKWKHILNFVLIGLMLTVFTVNMAKPYATLAANRQLEEVRNVCGYLDGIDKPAVLYVGLASNYFAFATRTVCNYSVASYKFSKNDNIVTEKEVGKLITEAKKGGYTPIIGVLGNQFELIADKEKYNFELVTNVEYQDVEKTLTTFPDRREGAVNDLYFYKP